MSADDINTAPNLNPWSSQYEDDDTADVAVLSGKAARKDYKFIISNKGEFVFISPALKQLWYITNSDDESAITNYDYRTLDISDYITFADSEEALDDRTFFNHSLISTSSDETSDDESSWINAVRAGCHTLLCGENQLMVDFQCDWVSVGDGSQSYLIASGPASPNIPQNEQRMRNLLRQVLTNQNTALKATNTSQRPKTPVSARLKNEEISHFMDMSRDLMCTTHIDGSLIRFNRSFEEILGYKPESLIGKSFMDFVYEEDRSLVRNGFYGLGYTESGNANAKDIDFEARMNCAEGDFRWINWQIRKQGSGFYCLGRDMTAIKAHEKQLNRRREELVEAQALARMGHWRWEVGADTIQWSEQLYHIFGVNKDEFITTMDNVNTLINRRDIGKLFQAFQRAIIQQNDYDMEFRIRRTDGQERYIKCEGRCDIDHEGDVIALYGIMQDITDRVIYEQELRSAKDAAEAAYASKSRFLANMSHELRTPLNAVIGFSEMMQHQLLGPLGNPKYLDYVGGIHKSGQHLLDLITDILDMSKIEAGKYELDIEDVNIAKSIALTLHMMEGRALDARVSLVTGSHLKDGGEDAGPHIKGDRRAIMQILLNLMSNAVKFTPEGGSVTADCTTYKKNIKITVKDTGIGIPANKLANVLMPFEQAAHEHTRDHEGSGLGLSITKELAELHGGSLKITSKIDQGTTVTVTLPYAPIIKKQQNNDKA